MDKLSFQVLNASDKQRELERFWRNNARAWCCSEMISELCNVTEKNGKPYCFIEEFDTLWTRYDELEGEKEGEGEPYPMEVLEWWSVDEHFAELLERQGECVAYDVWGIDAIWGRTTSGQAVYLDYCIEQAYADFYGWPSDGDDSDSDSDSEE